MHRRDALHALGGLFLAACGGGSAQTKANGAAAEPPASPLHVSPATDLAAAPGLTWLVEARMRELFASPDLIPALHQLVAEKRLDRFAARNGGVDPRQVRELVAAQYDASLLVIATGVFDPRKLEETFAQRASPLDGRAIDRANGESGAPLVPITRLWGSVRSERQQLAIMGREALALEQGRFGPLRAAEAFAQQKLKRAKPALRTSPLDLASQLLGDAPLRAFAPGPFTGEWAKGLGGLLEASTAAALAVRVGSQPGKSRVDVVLALTGGWADDAPAAAARLGAAFGRLAHDSLGKLCGLDRPLEPARTRGTADAVFLEVGLDALEIARGLRAATEAGIEEVMSY